MLNQSVKRPWYSEPYVWMLIAFPAIAVVAGFITLYLAIASSDGMVEDDYYKRGLEINRILDRDKAAATHGLMADVTFNVGEKRIQIHFNSKPEYQVPDSIMLSFTHHTRPGLDKKLLLQHIDANNYQVPLPELDAGEWTIEFAAADWRLMRAVKMPMKMSRDFRLTPLL
ncbi:MAG: FixH family protein [Thiotrichaceae bacterium]